MDNEFFNNIDGGTDDFDTKVSEILDASEKLPALIDEDELSIEQPSEDESTKNQNFALESIKNVAKITDQSIRELFILAKSTDSPRAWEVLAGMLKTQVDASESIVKISKKENVSINNVTNNTTNNTTIIQSSEDLFEFLDSDDDNDYIEGEVIDG